MKNVFDWEKTSVVKFLCVLLLIICVLPFLGVPKTADAKPTEREEAEYRRLRSVLHNNENVTHIADHPKELYSTYIMESETENIGPNEYSFLIVQIIGNRTAESINYHWIGMDIPRHAIENLDSCYLFAVIYVNLETQKYGITGVSVLNKDFRIMSQHYPDGEMMFLMPYGENSDIDLCVRYLNTM